MYRKWLVKFIAMSVMCLAGPVWANGVETLPEGIFAVGLKFGYKFANERFDKDFSSDTVSIVEDYRLVVKGTDIDPYMFAEDDVVGRLDPTYSNYGLQFTVTTAFGITDNLAVMMILPIQYVHNEFGVELYDSNLYMVRNERGEPSLIVNEGLKAGFSNASEKPLSTEEFQDALTCTANTQLCRFRYKPVRNWSRWGLGEIILGMRYKFAESEHWRQGITLFGKVPTGRQVDTDDLFDTNFGDQQVDIGFWYGIDYMPIKDLTLNVSFGYTEQLPQVINKRIFSTMTDENGKETGVLPLTQYWQKMKVHRDIGGNWDLYFGGAYNFTHYLNYSNEFYFFWKYLDNYWAAEEIPRDPNGGLWTPDFRAMEYGTDQSALEMTNALSFNTIGFMQRGEFPIPIIFSIGYTVGLAGQNFERNHSIWTSIDLVGSIYMFEDMSGEAEEEMTEMQLPAQVRNEDEADPDGLVAVDDAEPQESRKAQKMREAMEYRNTFGKVNKFDW